MHLSDQKQWSQDLFLHRLHLRVDSGGKSISLLICGLPQVSSFSSFISVSMVAIFGLVLICYSLEFYPSAIFAVLSVTLLHYTWYLATSFFPN